jgi:hypothetical protein
MAVDEHQKSQPEGTDNTQKEELVNIYVALLDKIWQRAVVVLGVVSMQAIVRHAIHLTVNDYPSMKVVSVNEQGINVDQLRQQSTSLEQDTMRQGFEALILNCFDLLVKLTGEAIASKLFAEDVSISRSNQ